jgi:glycosyltransferase involved in cell wall biosynthesis
MSIDCRAARTRRGNEANAPPGTTRSVSPEKQSRKLRVVLYEPAGRGGVCHYTYELAESLERAGVDVTLITTEDYELKRLERHFKIEYLFTKSLVTRFRRWSVDLFSYLYRRMRQRGYGEARRSLPMTGSVANDGRGYLRLLRSLRLQLLHFRAITGFLLNPPDVVHFQWLVNRSQDVRFIRWLRRLRIPAVYTAHDVEPHLAASPAVRRDLRWLYESVSRIVVHAEANKAELLSVFPVDASKIVVIPHGSHEVLFGPKPLTREAARHRIGVPQDARVILFFGLIKRYKGLEYLVEAFEKVRRDVRGAFLLIVGDIYAADDEAHDYYTRLIDGLRGREDVLCVTSYVPVEAVSTYLAAADVVALPYVRTYQSGVLLAAYGAGRPVVVTDTGGLAEIVENGRSGLIVKPEDADALASSLVDILRDSDLREAMGERARVLGTTAFAWNAVASRTIEVYRAVSAKPGYGSKGVSCCL